MNRGLSHRYCGTAEGEILFICDADTVDMKLKCFEVAEGGLNRCNGWDNFEIVAKVYGKKALVLNVTRSHNTISYHIKKRDTLPNYALKFTTISTFVQDFIQH